MFRLILRPTQDVKLGLHYKLLNLSVINTLRGVLYEPFGKCRGCNTVNLVHQIDEGFLQDRRNRTTKCSACGHRFVAVLITRHASGNSELEYYCPLQAHEALRHLYAHKPEEIFAHNPSAAHSAIVHFGSFRKMFEGDGKRYRFIEVPVWHAAVQDILGKAPDEMIANAVGVSVAVITKMRTRAKKAEFDPSTLEDDD